MVCYSYISVCTSGLWPSTSCGGSSLPASSSPVVREGQPPEVAPPPPGGTSTTSATPTTLRPATRWPVRPPVPPTSETPERPAGQALEWEDCPAPPPPLLLCYSSTIIWLHHNYSRVTPPHPPPCRPRKLALVTWDSAPLVPTGAAGGWLRCAFMHSTPTFSNDFILNTKNDQDGGRPPTYPKKKNICIYSSCIYSSTCIKRNTVTKSWI